MHYVPDRVRPPMVLNLDLLGNEIGLVNLVVLLFPGPKWMNPGHDPRYGYYQSSNPIFAAEMDSIPSPSPIAAMEMCSIQTRLG